MSRFDRFVCGSVRESVSEKGTGDGLFPNSPPEQEIIRGGEREGIKKEEYGNDRFARPPSPSPGEVSASDLADFEAHIARLAGWRSEPDRSDLARFLRANPGKTVRDWKGKGPSTPPEPQRWEQSWSRLKATEVRQSAVSAFARDLPHNVRQAAARDPGLIWNPLARKYRLRLPSDPQP